MNDQHPVEELPAFALGALEGTGRATVAAHVASCATCAARMRDYRSVIDVLPLALPPAAPPPEAWTAIRAATAVRPRPQRPWSRWLQAARWPAVAAALALLLVWNVALQRELDRRAPGPAPGPDVEALSRRPGRVLIFGGTGQPGANARLFAAVDGGGHLAVSGLARLPRERTYQLWFLKAGGAAISGATFEVNAHGRAWVKVAVPASLDDVETIVGTEELAPGASTPTGRRMLDALPWR